MQLNNLSLKRYNRQNLQAISLTKEMVDVVSLRAKIFTKSFKKVPCEQGCQMVYFQTKNPTLSKFLRALEWKMLVYFMVIWGILRPFGIFYGHLVMLW
jgi:hypothetical protein